MPHPHEPCKDPQCKHPLNFHGGEGSPCQKRQCKCSGYAEEAPKEEKSKKTTSQEKGK